MYLLAFSFIDLQKLIISTGDVCSAIALYNYYTYIIIENIVIKQ